VEALAELGIVEYACRKAEVGRRTVYQWRDGDDAFAARFYEAVERSTELMEVEAFRRAVRGVEKPVYQGKELVGHIREYSDVLLIFALKARKPLIYRERIDMKHSGEVAHKHEKLTDEELDARIAELVRKDPDLRSVLRKAGVFEPDGGAASPEGPEQPS